MKNKEKPAEGGAVGIGQETLPGVRDQIKAMTGHATDEEFELAVPENTDAVAEAPLKRKRRSKAEIELERGGTVLPPEDPLMSDPRYKKAIGRMNSLGGAAIIDTGFKLTGKPLEQEEKNEWDDFFYVVSKKGGLDPSQNWWLMGLFAFFLLTRHAVARTEIGEHFMEFFKPKEEKPTLQ